MSTTKEPTLQLIPLSQLHPSPSNPRSSFKQAELKELAENIDKQGVLSPLLVRPRAEGGFEIVDGERRFRAAKLAKQDIVPCIVRVMRDEAVVEAQIIASIQRADLSPLEEAQAYRQLLEESKYSLDDLAAAVSKDKAYIHRRFRLLALAPEVQEAILNGSLELAWAEQFSRVADKARQVELLKRTSTLSDLDHLKDVIEREFLLDLTTAPFPVKDPDLVPAAGACYGCPKRTGAQTELFGDSGKKDVCLDAACWLAKADAQRLAKVAPLEAKGETVLTGAKANKVLRKMSAWDKPFLTEKDVPQGVKGGKTVAELVKGKDLKPMRVYDNNSGKVLSVFKKEDVLAVVPANKLERYAKPTVKESPEELAAKARAAAVKNETEKLFLVGLVRGVAERSSWPAQMRELTARAVDNVDDWGSPVSPYQAMCLGLGWDGQGEAEEFIKAQLGGPKAKRTPAQLFRVLVAALAANLVKEGSDAEWADVLRDWARSVKVDLKKLEKTAIEGAEKVVQAREQAAQAKGVEPEATVNSDEDAEDEEGGE